MIGDLYYNPNLTLEREDFAVDLSRSEGAVRTFSQERVDEVVGPLSRHTSVGQPFRMRDGGLCGIAIRFSTYRMTCSGRVRLCVRETDARGKSLVEMEIDAADIRDNEYHQFFLPPLFAHAGKELCFFNVEFEAGEDGRELAIWKSTITDPRATESISS